jgi:hypothetical protein
MQQIAMPYQTQSGTLTMQHVRWPPRCACCGSDNVSTHYRLEHRAELREIETNKVSFYPLSWNVPYCSTCLKHARTIPVLKMVVYLAGGLLWVGFGYGLFLLGLAEETVGVVIFVLSLAVIGFGSYKVAGLLARVLIETTPTCSQEDIAIKVFSSSLEQKVIFTFYNDDYAAAFASLNGRE